MEARAEARVAKDAGPEVALADVLTIRAAVRSQTWHVPAYQRKQKSMWPRDLFPRTSLVSMLAVPIDQQALKVEGIGTTRRTRRP